MRKKDFKAVIFDCDGVIMDSEYLACEMSARCLRELGIDITTDHYIDNFMGKGFKQALKHFGFDGSERDKLEKKGLNSPYFKENLHAIDGISYVLENLRLPYCIASGSSLYRLNLTLEMTGLTKYFNTYNVFSADMVAHPKPAPDIFLFAAEKLGIPPEKCLVIEDGVHGTSGAVAAGMTVYGFTGASHMNKDREKRLKETGAELLFSKMKYLPDLIKKT